MTERCPRCGSETLSARRPDRPSTCLACGYEEVSAAAPAPAGFGSITWQAHVIDSFPRPLAHGYACLKEEVARGDAVAAAWAIRDAWGSALRFASCVAIADLLQAGAESESFARALAVLFKWDGPSLPDWTSLLAAVGRDDIAAGIARRLPGLGRAESIASDVVPRLDRLFAESRTGRDRSRYEEQTAGC